MSSVRARTGILLVASAIVLIAIAFYLTAGHKQPDTRVYRIGWEHDPPFQVALPNGQPSGLAIELVR